MLPNWFETYLGLEQAASVIRAYEPQLVPGLLQTEDYARAIMLLRHLHVSVSEIERRVALRMTRQPRRTSAQKLLDLIVADPVVLVVVEHRQQNK